MNIFQRAFAENKMFLSESALRLNSTSSYANSSIAASETTNISLIYYQPLSNELIKQRQFYYFYYKSKFWSFKVP